MRGRLAEPAGPPLGGLEPGRVQHEAAARLVEHGLGLQRAHVGPVAQLSLSVRAENAEGARQRKPPATKINVDNERRKKKEC